MTDLEKLREIALDQHGYVTSTQAQEVGVKRASLTYLVKHDRLERTLRGIYRVPQVPYTEHDAKHLAILWVDPDSAVLGYDTALATYDVCDINPMKVHVVVDKGKRINRSGGEAYIVHKEELRPQDITWWEGMRTVRLAVALRQCIDSGLPTHLANQAIENATSRGMLTSEQADDIRQRLDRRNNG